jgi:2,5-diketo-D-gluconate reductase B
MIDLTLSNGATMPALGMGTWQLEGAAAVSATTAALRVGYRHIDTAQIYDNEGEVGTAIRQSGIARGEIFLTTKVWTNRFRAGDLQASVDESLSRLATDYVDLLLLHWMQPKVPLAETIAALNEVVRAGKTRAIGVSNFTVAGMREAVALSAAPIVTNQIEYHALLSQRSVLAAARELGITVTAYSPLAQGQLRDNAVLAGIGAAYGKSASQVALRWLVQQSGVAAIPKASGEKNLRANFEIFDFTLTADEIARIDALQGDTRLCDFNFSPAWDRP